jgi:cytochrome c peroxidase
MASVIFRVSALFAAQLAMGCGIDSSLIIRPSGVRPFQGEAAALEAEGERLWSDEGLSKNGDLSCNSCHLEFSSFESTFREPYPHRVAMAESKAGLKSVTAEQMVQFCLLMPMGRETALPWDSRELRALSLHVESLQREFSKR